MTAADRFARWVSIRSNQNAVLIALGAFAVFMMFLAGDTSPIEMVRP